MLANFLPLARYPYCGEAVDCPVCGAADHELICRYDRKLKRLDTHLCNACGLFFTNPMPTNAELERYYRTTYRLEYQLARFQPRTRHQRKKRREAALRARRIESALRRDGPLRVLDFGCGSGELVEHLVSQGHDAYGFEPGADFASFARSRVTREGALGERVRSQGWREISFPPSSFDVVTCLHVLEHLNEPMAALAAMRDWLKPDGALYLEVPNMQAYYLKGFENFHFAHVLGFSPANLKHALALQGFRHMREDAPVSLFAVKADNPLGAAYEYDLEAAVRQNKAEYGRGVTALSYLKYHKLRAARLLSPPREESAPAPREDVAPRRSRPSAEGRGECSSDAAS